MRFLIGISVLVFALTGCKTGTRSESAQALKLQPLQEWAPRQEQKSWDHMQENISPKEPKVAGEAPPVKGIVVAAFHKREPDYYFHWIRDSAHVMGLVADAYALKRPYISRALVDAEFSDFLTLTHSFQTQKSKYGMGEPRYRVDGIADTLPWSRPQFDGPALRALAVLRYLNATAKEPNTKVAPLAKQVLLKDLSFITEVYDKRGFDIWEEYNAENYHTRLVQLAAMQKGAAWLAKQKPAQPQLVARMNVAAKNLQRVLDDHWDPARGFLKSQLAIVATDGYTAKKTDMDSAVVLAVMDSDLDQVSHSVLDDRVQATVAVLEDLFKKTYPINAREDVGLAYGRYFGDIYYGGNPWFLITAYYAEFYYRLARKLQAGEGFAVTPKNLGFLKFSKALGAVGPGQVILPGTPLHKDLVRDLKAKGDSILQRFQLHTPADGQLYEQFDKVTGLPASSKGIGWSHSAFLSAAFERHRLGL